MPQMQFEPVIGLEIHAQLLTMSKLFCGDSTGFGSEPNTHISAISLAHPGTLPVLNREAISLALRLGIALGCTINETNYFARKNYFYPDLPKGYQVSQHTVPICSGGAIPIILDGVEKHISLNRIHIEEDAGKSVHDASDDFSGIDLNRAGVPLVEIVTEPVISSAEEAYECLAMIRKIVRRLGVCDGNMEEGSLRCDANISVRRKGETLLGTKVEVKNLNSVRNVKRAILYETDRLTDLLSSGKEVIQETRGFDAAAGTTSSQRTKEEANDYRYFPEPDLPPVFISKEMITAIEKELPALPHMEVKQIAATYAITEDAATVICDDELLLDLFNKSVQKTSHFTAVANWLIGPVKAWLNELESDQKKISFEKIVSLADLTAEGHVAFSAAAAKIFPEIVSSDRSAMDIAGSLNLIQVSNENLLNAWVDDVINRMPAKVAEYKKGKKNLIGLFAGEVKKLSKGKADMKSAITIITEKLNN